ncbi:hypothetical protein EVAR_61340_1 [Eumeta japonica]|uniref:Uncharacterized protein n=1 Tax=Eumeta variegata TaxID=151549 RepID=A0A4C1Y588_EUMVA|nr:hypothetical protein EVAR_61340_1 [Eumeta japonica]
MRPLHLISQPGTNHTPKPPKDYQLPRDLLSISLNEEKVLGANEQASYWRVDPHYPPRGFINALPASWVGIGYLCIGVGRLGGGGTVRSILTHFNSIQLTTHMDSMAIFLWSLFKTTYQNITSAPARATLKYRSWLSLERGGYGLRMGTPMYCVKRVEQFQERHKVATERSVDDADFAKQFFRCCTCRHLVSVLLNGLDLILSLSVNWRTLSTVNPNTTGDGHQRFRFHPPLRSIPGGRLKNIPLDISTEDFIVFALKLPRVT